MPYPAAVLAVAAVIVAGSAAGVLAARRRPDATALADRLLWLSLWVILPPVTFFNFAHFEPSADVGVGLLFAYLGLSDRAARRLAARARPAAPRRTHARRLHVRGVPRQHRLPRPAVHSRPARDATPCRRRSPTTSSCRRRGCWWSRSRSAPRTRTRRAEESRMRAFLTRNPALFAMVLGLLAPAGARSRLGRRRLQRARRRAGSARLLRAGRVRDAERRRRHRASRRR